MNKITLILISVALILLCIYLLFNFQNGKVIYLTDTLKLTDTAIIKYERIIPKKIYIHKIDTIDIIKEVITGLEKKKDNISVVSRNKKYSIIKKYEFPNIYRDFFLQSDSGGIKLYRKNSGPDRLRIKAGISNLNFRDSIKSKIYAGIETGIYYKRLSINAGINYFPFIHKFGLDINISFLIR